MSPPMRAGSSASDPFTLHPSLSVEDELRFNVEGMYVVCIPGLSIGSALPTVLLGLGKRAGELRAQVHTQGGVQDWEALQASWLRYSAPVQRRPDGRQRRRPSPSPVRTLSRPPRTRQLRSPRAPVSPRATPRTVPATTPRAAVTVPAAVPAAAVTVPAAAVRRHRDPGHAAELSPRGASSASDRSPSAADTGSACSGAAAAAAPLRSKRLLVTPPPQGSQTDVSSPGSLATPRNFSRAAAAAAAVPAAAVPAPASSMRQLGFSGRRSPNVPHRSPSPSSSRGGDRSYRAALAKRQWRQLRDACRSAEAGDGDALCLADDDERECVLQALLEDGMECDPAAAAAVRAVHRVRFPAHAAELLKGCSEDGPRCRAVFHGITGVPTDSTVRSVALEGLDPARCRAAMWGVGAYVAASGQKAVMYASGGKWDRRGGKVTEKHDLPLKVLVLLLQPGQFTVGERGLQHSTVTADSQRHPTQFCIPPGHEHRAVVTHVVTIDPPAMADRPGSPTKTHDSAAS